MGGFDWGGSWGVGWGVGAGVCGVWVWGLQRVWGLGFWAAGGLGVCLVGDPGGLGVLES